MLIKNVVNYINNDLILQGILTIVVRIPFLQTQSIKNNF